MVEQVTVDLRGEWAGLRGAVFRYDVVERLRRTCDGRGVAFLAFGFAEDHLRFVVDGDEEDVREVVRGLKVGTVRAAARWGLSLASGSHRRQAAASVEDGVIWAHRAVPADPALGPLATPWTSHRDLLGFRRAGFFDSAVVAARVDVARVHEACGGRGIPRAPALPGPPRTAPELSFLLRVAAAVVGVLPADRRCFRPFVRAARTCGFATADLARALAVTPRRVRQIAAEEAPEEPLVLRTLRDPALSRVP